MEQSYRENLLHKGRALRHPAGAEDIGARARRSGSNTDYDLGVDHPLAPAPAYLANFLATFREYPQRLKAASFNLDEVAKKMQSPGKH